LDVFGSRDREGINEGWVPLGFEEKLLDLIERTNGGDGWMITTCGDEED